MYIVAIGSSISCSTALFILIATYEFLHAEVFKSRVIFQISFTWEYVVLHVFFV
jgi:hypothetical protein